MENDREKNGGVTRRDFLILTATAAVATGCQTVNKTGTANAPHSERVVDAGPVTNYAADGVYTHFHDSGFFVIRKNRKLAAFSAICTHRNCKLTAEPDYSFYCDCHGSTFDPSGKVTEGPAKRDLPIFSTSTSEEGHLFVKVLNT